jgi:dipeptidyl aminopeptidase/acylaminoacyl peptidase
VTDIALQFNSSGWASSEMGRAMAAEVMGDPNLEYDELRRYSPVYHTDKIRVSIFLAHGLQDQRVDVDHAYRMKAMLELHGIPLRWDLMEDSGHGFPSNEAAIRYYVDLREFLAEHLRD